MSSVYEVEKGLPPGLWLPTAEEQTEQFLTENFARQPHEYEDIVDYGAFIVALASYEQSNTNRISLMPVKRDFDDLYDAGYGFSFRTLGRRYDGLGKLQRSLGFYPPGYTPPVDKVLKRFQWIADYGYAQDPLPEGLEDIEQLLLWGSTRHFTPWAQRVYKMLDGDTTVLRKMFGLEKRGFSRQFSFLNLYCFGANVVRDNGGPISISELNDKYADSFVNSPYDTIVFHFGTMTKFWQEFDFIQSMPRGLTKQDVVNCGVQRAIKLGEPRVDISSGVIDELSRQNRFPSQDIIANHFEGIASYREAVQVDYNHYLRLQEEHTLLGVKPAVFKAVCRNFEATPKFEATLKNNIRVLLRLSKNWDSEPFVPGILENGFNLLDEHILEMQFEDFVNCLADWGIRGDPKLRYIFDIVPRFNSGEAISRIRNQSIGELVVADLAKAI